jgi:aminoglycoside phosphotransferase
LAATLDDVVDELVHIKKLLRQLLRETVRLRYLNSHKMDVGEVVVDEDKG